MENFFHQGEQYLVHENPYECTMSQVAYMQAELYAHYLYWFFSLHLNSFEPRDLKSSHSDRLS